MRNIKSFIEKIKNKKLNVGVIGMGYVGLPLSILIAKKNFKVFGFDQDNHKIKQLVSKDCYIKHISKNNLRKVIDNNTLFPTSNFKLLSNMDIIIICVPTPLTKSKKPNLKFVNSATKKIIKKIKKKSPLIILESTTYPGTCKELLKKFYVKNNFIDGKNFFMSYSPEREDPGNKKFTTENIPKVIGADKLVSKKIIKAFYSKIFKKVIEVDSLDVAEATKIYENIFRAVNIALVNEMKFAFKKININVWDVIKASKTKPFGFMPFYPGPGLGGHCIPIDPIYFSWKLDKHKFNCKFIKLGKNRHYPRLQNKKNTNLSIQRIKKYDLILILTDHDYVNYDMIKNNSKLIIDTRNVFSKFKDDKIIRM